MTLEDGGTEEEECLTQMNLGRPPRGRDAQVSEKKEEVARGGRGGLTARCSFVKDLDLVGRHK